MTLYEGDTFEHGGARFRVTFENDDDRDTPWDREDGHGPVSGWKRHAFGQGTKPPKAPGERILIWDNGSYLTYDFAEAIKIAKREGWDAEPFGTGTRGQKAARAVEADFKRLADWCADRWSYVGCIVTLLDDFGDPIEDASASVWGIESDAGDYFDEIARELADEIAGNIQSIAA